MASKNKQSDNEQLYQDAIDAINTMFSDISVSRSTTLGNLQGLMAEIALLMDSLS